MPTDPATLHFTVNGRPLTAAPGTSLAAAMLNAGISTFRRSTTGEARAPLCGMGVCFECRVTIDGHPHQKSCQIVVQPGMEVRTDE
jgi:sarcosine oxidase subunit alpha